MIEFLKGGKTLHGITMGMTVDSLYPILGRPTNVMGDKERGYINFGAYRYGYTDDIINEMAIEFKYFKKPLEFKNLEYRKYDISLFEDFRISSKSKIHTIIAFINHLQLDWKAQNGIDKDCFALKIKNGPFIIFDLFDGTVDKISIVDGYQNQ